MNCFLLCNNLNPLHRKMLCAEFVEIGLVVLEEKIFKFHQCIFPISLLSSLGDRHDPSFEQTQIPFSQQFFVTSLVKIDPVVLDKKIFKICQCILAILLLSTLGKGHGPLFE